MLSSTITSTIVLQLCNQPMWKLISDGTLSKYIREGKSTLPGVKMTYLEVEIYLIDSIQGEWRWPYNVNGPSCLRVEFFADGQW